MQYKTQLEKAIQTLNQLTGLQLCMEVSGEEEAKQAYQQVQQLSKIYKERFSEVLFFQSLLLEEHLLTEVLERAKQFHLDMEETRVVLYVRSQTVFDEDMKSILQSLIDNPKKTKLIPVSDCEIAVVHSLKEKEEIEHFAHMISDTLATEAMTKVKISYSSPVSQIQKLNLAWQEAVIAMQVGMIFYDAREIYSYSQLGLGGLIYELPPSAGKRFLDENFKNARDLLENPDVCKIVDCLMQHDLNVTEAARQLHMHRNTLANHIEQIRQKTNLNLRTFEDLMIFKVAIMIQNYMK